MIVEPDPLDTKRTTEIPVAEIELRKPSPVSPMPANLLDTLDREEILDLLAYLEASGETPAIMEVLRALILVSSKNVLQAIPLYLQNPEFTIMCLILLP